MRAALALVVAACGGAQSPEPTKVPSVAVLEAGAEPREVIRIAPPLHLRERMELDIKVRQSTSRTNTVLETETRTADYPTIRLTMTREVTALDARGDVSIASEVDDVAVLEDVIDPALRERVVVETAALAGLRSSWRVESSGRTFARETPNAPSVPSLEGSMQDASVVFPDVPLGVGATWTVASVDRPANVTWHRTAKYRLVMLTETSATVDVALDMQADSQVLHVEPNATTRLTSGRATVTGQLVVPRHGLVATGSLQSTSEANFQIVRGHLRLASRIRSETLAVSRRIADQRTERRLRPGELTSLRRRP